MSRASGRVEGVDAVRGLAILLMVFSHGLNWFHVKGSHHVFSIGRMSLGDVATPLFFVIAGIALALSLASRRRKAATSAQIGSDYGRRFRQLFILGIPISFAWGVLQAQALLLGLFVFLTLHVFERETISPTLRLWPFGLGAGALVLHEVIIGTDGIRSLLPLLLEGQFPLFALLAFIGIGFGMGGLLQRSTWPRTFYGVGAGLALGAWAAGHASNSGVKGAGADVLVRADMPLPFVLFGLAATLLLLAVTEAPLLRASRPIRWLGSIGRYGLFLYLAHYVLILAFIGLFGWWQSLETPAAVAASVLLVLMTAFVGLYYRIDARMIYFWLDTWGRRWAHRTPVHASGYDARLAVASEVNRVHQTMGWYGNSVGFPPR